MTSLDLLDGMPNLSPGHHCWLEPCRSLRAMEPLKFLYVDEKQRQQKEWKQSGEQAGAGLLRISQERLKLPYWEGFWGS